MIEGTTSTTVRGSLGCEGLTRRFGDHVALAPLDIDIGPGGVTGLLGPNGSGKSTFMRCLIGLVRPDAGRAWADGVDLSGDGAGVRRRVTYSPGELHLYGEMRGDEHLDWLLRGRAPEARAKARELAEGLELPLRRRVRGYSHGMKRQLVFVAALAPEVHVRILDEPTEGLDPTKRSQLLDLLRADAERGTTILLSSHHLGEVDRACDRLLFLDRGRLIADESPAEVHARASRLLHLSWEGSVPAGLEDALAGPAVERIQVDGARASVLLTERDPRAFLAQFAARTDLPAPRRLEHGRLSLTDLYRDLYGVEGV